MQCITCNRRWWHLVPWNSSYSVMCSSFVIDIINIWTILLHEKFWTREHSIVFWLDKTHSWMHLMTMAMCCCFTKVRMYLIPKVINLLMHNHRNVKNTVHHLQCIMKKHWHLFYFYYCPVFGHIMPHSLHCINVWTISLVFTVWKNDHPQTVQGANMCTVIGNGTAISL